MNPELAKLKKSFFETPFAFDPVVATFWGVPGYDGELQPDTPELRERRRSFYEDLKQKLEVLRSTQLSTRDHTDLTIMQTEISFQLDSLDRISPLSWRNSTGLTDLIDIVYFNVRHQSGQGEAWKNILSRMEKIPNYIEQRQANLTLGLNEEAPFYRREVLLDGIELVPTLIRFFENSVLGALPISLKTKFETSLQAAHQAIDQTLQSYVAFLKQHVLPVAQDNAFALGKEEYERRLKSLLFCDQSAQELFAYGHAQVEATTKEMLEIAKRVAVPQAEAGSLSTIFKALGRKAPDDDQAMMKMYEGLVEKAVVFVRKKKLFLLPDDYTMELVETPEAFHNFISVAAMNAIPPFLDGVASQFYVTPTRDPKHPDGNPETLQLNHALADAPNLVVHEAVPGHDLQLGAAARQFIEGGRKDLSYLVQLRSPWITSALGVEGWAHYTEQLMAEEGFYSPEEHLAQLKAAQWRNVRVAVDVGIHTGLMDYQEAIDFTEKHTFSGPLTAQREVYRYSKWPLQALTYHLGKKDLLGLRQRAIDEMGKERFNLALFHREVLKYNGVPVSLYREQLIADLKEKRTTP